MDNTHHVICILCYFFSFIKDSLCVLSFACSALNFRLIVSVLIVFHTLTIFCCCQTQNGFSPVYVASNNGYAEVVDLLVQAGANIHLATTEEVYVSTYTVLSSIVTLGTLFVYLYMVLPDFLKLELCRNCCQKKIISHNE